MPKAKAEIEQERIARLKRQQIAARNPGDSKIKGYDWSKHNKKSQAVAKKQRETPLLKEIWEQLPGRWRGAMYGVLFALLIGVFLWIVVLGDELKILAAVPLVFGGIMGYVVGKSTEITIP